MSDHWPAVTFNDLIVDGVLEIGDGYRAKLEELGGDGPIFVRAGKLTERGFNWSDSERFNSELAPKLASKFGQPEDTVITTKGNSVGRTGYVPHRAPEFVYSPHLSYWRCLDRTRLVPGYLRYWARSPEFEAQLRAMAHSTDMAPYLSLQDQRRLQFALPPIEHQNATASVLGTLDDMIAVNESCLRSAHQLMKYHFELAMTQGSVAATIGDVAKVFDGPHATPEKTASGPWFLSISSLQNGRLVLTDSAHLGEQDFAHWTRRVTPSAGDVLFSYETRLGEAAIMPDGVRACLGRRMALLRPRIDVLGPRTLLQSYLGESFQETIRQRAVHGATVDRIPLTELPAWPITVPERADRLESLLGAIDDMAAQRERENETLAALRETLLPKLMSGEIRVRDAEKVVEEAL